MFSSSWTDPAPGSPDALPPETIDRCSRLLVHFFGRNATLYAARQIAEHLENGDLYLLGVWNRIARDLEDRLVPLRPLAYEPDAITWDETDWARAAWSDADFEDIEATAGTSAGSRRWPQGTLERIRKVVGL